jgi:hypothetical protein
MSVDYDRTAARSSGMLALMTSPLVVGDVAPESGDHRVDHGFDIDLDLAAELVGDPT